MRLFTLTMSVMLLTGVNAKRFTALTVSKVAPAEYLVAYLMSDGSVRAYINDVGASVHFTPYTFGGRTALDVAPAFNHVVILDDQHYTWLNTPSGTTPAGGGCTRFNTDSAGNTFNYLYAIYAYFNCYLGTTQHNDSLIYWATNDGMQWIDGTGSRSCKAFTVWTPPSGRTIQKVATGLTCMVLLDNGDVYTRATGASSFTKVTLPAGSYCVDLSSSYRDFMVLLLHTYAGGSSSCGVISWMGSESGYFGDNNSRTTPFLLGWSYPNHFKKVACNDNTYILIDSAGNMYGGGDNPQGEVGNGIEIVNRYNYQNFCCVTPYAWSTDKGQAFTFPAVQIGAGHTWKSIAEEKGFAFHHFAADINDSLYRWGRSKSFDLWPLTANNEATYSNCWDILAPRAWTPIADSNYTGNYITFILPKVHAGGNQSITTNSVTMGGPDTAAFAGPVGYSISSYQWSKKSGPSSPSFGAPTSAFTTAGPLINGTYVFYKKMTDINTGIWADSVTIIVSLAPCAGCVINRRATKHKVLSK